MEESQIENTAVANTQASAESLPDPMENEAFAALIEQRRQEQMSKGLAVGEILPAIGDFGAIPQTVSKSKKIVRDLELGLYDDIPEEDRQKAMETAQKNLEKLDVWNQEKNLEKDIMTIPGQKYAVVCWVGPNFKAKTTVYGFRLMGAFKDLKSATKHAQKVNRAEPMYDCGVVEMNYWCFNYPDVSDGLDENGNPLSTEDTQAKYDAALNSFIVEHKIQREQSKQLFQARKNMLLRSNVTKEAEMPDDLKVDDIKGRPSEKLEEIHIKETKKWSNQPALHATHERLREIIRKREELEEQVEKEEDLRINEEGEVELDLTPSTTRIHGQEYAAISFVGHTGTNQRIPLSIKGFYDSKEECEEAIKKLTQMENSYDIIPAPLYCWLPCDPDISQVKHVHTNERLNNLVEGAANESNEAMRFHAAVASPNEEVMDKPFDPNFQGKGVTPWNPSSEMFDEGDEPPSSATNVFQGAESGNIPTFSFQGHAGGAQEDLRDVWEGNVDVDQLDRVTDQIEQAKAKANEAYAEIKQFEELEENVHILENRLAELMAEGYTEAEAKKMLRVKESEGPKYSTPDEEDLEPIEKPKAEFKTIQELMAEQQATIERMKESGKSPKEIREYLASNPIN